MPLHRPSQRQELGLRCLPDATAKWQAVADAVERVAVQQGRPVLIGTRTVRASEEISAVLQARGLAHVVLNAKQDRGEAELISQAGQPSRITVATNMAGRGTDILLSGGVAGRGGLHITSLDTEMAEACPQPELLGGIGDALDELARMEPALAQVVDLKFFCGFSMAEIAALTGSSERSVQRQWEKARMLLFRAMQPD